MGAILVVVSLSVAGVLPALGAPSASVPAASPQVRQMPVLHLRAYSPWYGLHWVAAGSGGAKQAGWQVSCMGPVPRFGAGPPPPPETFPRLSDPALRAWVGHLPPGSHLLCAVNLGPILFKPGPGGSPEMVGEPPRILDAVTPELSALGRYCQGMKVGFESVFSGG